MKVIINMNKYIDEHGIKKTYISEVTGLEISKVRRILKSQQNPGYEDLKLIAKCLGPSLTYFEYDEYVSLSAIEEPEIKISYSISSDNPLTRECGEAFVELIQNIHKLNMANSVDHASLAVQVEVL